MQKRISSLQILSLLAILANEPAVLAAGDNGASLCGLAAFQQSELVKTGGWPGVGPFRTVNGELVDADKNKLKIESSQNDVTAAELHINVPSGSFTNIEMSADFLLESMGAKAVRIAEINGQFEKEKLRLPAALVDSPISMTSGKFLVKVHRVDAPLIQSPNDPVKRWPFVIRVTGRNSNEPEVAPLTEKPAASEATATAADMPDKPGSTDVTQTATVTPPATITPPVAETQAPPPKVVKTVTPPSITTTAPTPTATATKSTPKTSRTPKTATSKVAKPSSETTASATSTSTSTSTSTGVEKIASAETPLRTTPVAEPNSTTPTLAESMTQPAAETTGQQGVQALAPNIGATTPSTSAETAAAEEGANKHKKKEKKERVKKPKKDKTEQTAGTTSDASTTTPVAAAPNAGDLTPQPTTTNSNSADSVITSTTTPANTSANTPANTSAAAGTTHDSSKPTMENGWETATEVPAKPSTEFTLVKPSELPAVKSSSKTKIASALPGTKTTASTAPKTAATTPSEAPDTTPASTTTPETATTSASTGDPLKDEFKSVLEGWQKIKSVAVKEHKTDDLTTVLSGKALARQQNAIKWLTDQHKYYEMSARGVDVDKCTTVAANQKYIVAAHVHEKSKFMDENTNQVLKETDDSYNVNYTIEKISGKWMITDSAIIAQNQKPATPQKKR